MKKIYWNLKKFFKKQRYLSVITLVLTIILLLSLALVRSETSILTAVNNLAQKNPRLFSVAKSIVRLTDIPFRLAAFFVPEKLPRYSLIISQNDLDFLNQNIPKDKEKFTDQYKQSVSATFIFEDETYPVKVRYRGDNPNHWNFAKKSWRINFRDKPFKGKESIDLIIPEDRGYFQELTMAKLAEKMELTVPKMSLVNLSVNNKNNGVYLSAEHWSESFLETRGQAFTNNLYGENDFNFAFPGSIYYSSAQLQKLSSDQLSKQNNFADYQLLTDILVLENDQQFLTKFKQLVDTDNFLKWQAHSTLFFSRSQRKTHNLILNFNSQSGKLEFIPWNITMTTKDINYENINVDYNPLMTRALLDTQLYTQRNQVLWQTVKTDSVIKELISFINDQQKLSRFDIYKDTLRRFTVLEMEVSTRKFKQQLPAAFERIKKNLQQAQTFIFVTTKPQSTNYSDNIAFVDIENRGFSPTKIKELSIETSATISGTLLLFLDSDSDKQLTGRDKKLGKFENSQWNSKDNLAESEIKLKDFIISSLRIWYDINGERDEVSPDERRQRLFITSSEPLNLIDLKAKSTNAVTNKKSRPYAIRIINDSTFRYLNLINQSRDDFLIKYPQFKGDPASDTGVILPAQNHTFLEPVIVPNTVELTILPGAKLAFGPKVSLVSYGKVFALGTDSKPIVFTAASTAPWGVFGVVGKQAAGSLFEFVRVQKASESYLNGIYFTGGLAIHYANATIKNSYFGSNKGDDGLNIKHASVIIANNQFMNNQFDGLDLDVVTGEVVGNQFLRNGNDGLDISFAPITIKNNIFENNGDKCISVGESSRPTISQNTISGCNMGIGVKDQSEALIDSNQIFANNIGIAAYQKKEIFGGATVNETNNQFNDNDVDFKIDKNSTLNHDKN